MYNELLEPIRQHFDSIVARERPRTATEILEKLGVRNPRDVNDAYAWLRPAGYQPAIVMSVWLEQAHIDQRGRWYYVDDLDFSLRPGGSKRHHNQYAHARERIALLRKAWKQKTPVRTLLQINGTSNEALQKGEASHAQRRVIDTEDWHVAEWFEPEPDKGWAVLVRGTNSWATTLQAEQSLTVATSEEEPSAGDFSRAIKSAVNYVGGGESAEHKALKEYIRVKPHVIGIEADEDMGKTEYCLPSGDSLDVCFDTGAHWVAVEVKSRRSNVADITRGLFQCVKYLAVMDAVVRVEPRSRATRAVLVLEGVLPRELVLLQQRLGVEVVDNIYSRCSEDGD